MTPSTITSRTRPTPRIVVLLGLSVLIYGAGANIGAGTVLLLAAGMAVGTVWSVVGFLRRVGDVRLRTDAAITVTEGRVTVPFTVTVPTRIIGVLRLAPTLPSIIAAQVLGETGGAPPGAHLDDLGEQWATLPRSGTTAQVTASTVLARGDEQQLTIDLDVTDAFGLIRRRTTMTGPVADVTPARGAAAVFTADTVEGDEDESIAHALVANGAPSTELRPWRPGEAVRAVHWAASERADHLLVRPRGPETQQRRTLVVEDQPWSRAALDVRCRDLAATADRLVATGVQVELAAGGQVVDWGHEARRLLASLQPNAASIPAEDGPASSEDR